MIIFDPSQSFPTYLLYALSLKTNNANNKKKQKHKIPRKQKPKHTRKISLGQTYKNTIEFCFVLTTCTWAWDLLIFWSFTIESYISFSLRATPRFIIYIEIITIISNSTGGINRIHGWVGLSEAVRETLLSIFLDRVLWFHELLLYSPWTYDWSD